jgi:hypothetical protein
MVLALYYYLAILLMVADLDQFNRSWRTAYKTLLACSCSKFLTCQGLKRSIDR